MVKINSDHSVEASFKIYNVAGYYYEVCSDPDGFGSIKIRYFDDQKDTEPTSEISITPDIVDKIHELMHLVAGQTTL
jgi:hypothetical protein